MSTQEASNPRIGLTLGLSLVTGALAAILFVLPAEYGIDPTGVGKALGIDGMSGVSVSALSRNVEPYRTDEVEFPLMPFESVEFKYEMHAGDAMVYTWSTEAEVVFDFHGHEPDTDPESATSFSIGRAAGEHGAYVAPFAGEHGWYWENRGDAEVTVRLITSGFFDAAITYSPAGEFRRDFN